MARSSLAILLAIAASSASVSLRAAPHVLPGLRLRAPPPVCAAAAKKGRKAAGGKKASSGKAAAARGFGAKPAAAQTAAAHGDDASPEQREWRSFEAWLTSRGATIDAIELADCAGIRGTRATRNLKPGDEVLRIIPVVNHKVIDILLLRWSVAYERLAIAKENLRLTGKRPMLSLIHI